MAETIVLRGLLGTAVVVVTISGRGEKDMRTVANAIGVKL